MKFMPLLTIAALAIAIVAAVFAIWPVVTDAPWEESAPAVVDDGTDDVRCEGALSLRASVIEAGRENPGGGFGRGFGEEPSNPGGLRDYEEQLAKAENEINSYC